MERDQDVVAMRRTSQEHRLVVAENLVIWVDVDFVQQANPEITFEFLHPFDYVPGQLQHFKAYQRFSSILFE